MSIAKKIFKSKKNKDITKVKTHTIHYGTIMDPDKQEVIDEVLLMIMRGPNTYTMEDVVEINCHGGMIPIQKVLEQVLKEGARIAEPGEFTKRAFLNGRLDLSQAEAVMDIIDSKTDVSLHAAVDQLEGSLSARIKDLRQQLLEMIAHIEASIDYPEYDIEELTHENIQSTIQETQENIEMLLKTSDAGKVIREGVKTVIVGKPNVGKSSLLNALLREQRAIVTDIPGTTRDVLEEYINIQGIPFQIIDTAGIRETEDIVEKIGVDRSKKWIEQADLVILMLDLSICLSEEDRYIMTLLQNKKSVVILNKTDLEPQIDIQEIRDYFEEDQIIEISAKTHKGIDELEERLKGMFFAGVIQMNKDVMITNVRHKHSLQKAQRSLKKVLESAVLGMGEDFISIDLMDAYKYLGEITGETVEEDLIHQIFSQFCLGK